MANSPISHHWVDVVTMGRDASHDTRPSTWSSRFSPTPGESTRTGTPISRRWPAGPMPDSINSFGVSMAPAQRTTSRRAETTS